MSHYLSQLEGSERAQECIRNDKEMERLHPVFVRALLPFIPPSVEELEAADLAEDQGKAARRHAVSDRCALELQVQQMREAGAL